MVAFRSTAHCERHSAMERQENTKVTKQKKMCLTFRRTKISNVYSNGKFNSMQIFVVSGLLVKETLLYRNYRRIFFICRLIREVKTHKTCYIIPECSKFTSSIFPARMYSYRKTVKSLTSTAILNREFNCEQ